MIRPKERCRHLSRDCMDNSVSPVQNRYFTIVHYTSSSCSDAETRLWPLRFKICFYRAISNAKDQQDTVLGVRHELHGNQGLIRSPGRTVQRVDVCLLATAYSHNWAWTPTVKLELLVSTKRVLSTVSNVQEAILILMVIINFRHQRRCKGVTAQLDIERQR